MTPYDSLKKKGRSSPDSTLFFPCILNPAGELSCKCLCHGIEEDFGLTIILSCYLRGRVAHTSCAPVFRRMCEALRCKEISLKMKHLPRVRDENKKARVPIQGSALLIAADSGLFLPRG